MENVVTGSSQSPWATLVAFIVSIALLLVLGKVLGDLSRFRYLHKHLRLDLRRSACVMTYEDIILFYELPKKLFIDSFDFIRSECSLAFTNYFTDDNFPPMSEDLLDRLYPLKKRGKKDAE